MGLYRKYLDRIVVPSKFYRDKLIEWGWPAEQLVYVPNFVNPELLAGPSTAEGDYYLFAGRLAPEKGIATLIEAAARSGLKLVVAGSGPDEPLLKQLAADRNAPVTFVGSPAGLRMFAT